MAERIDSDADDAQLPSESGAVPALIAIDACRPDSADFERELPPENSAAIRHDKRLTDRYRAVQKFDRKVAAAFRSVPVPMGLEAKLLAAIAEQQAEQDSVRGLESTGPVELATPPAPYHSAPVESRSLRSTRRRWLQIAGGAIASTAAGVGFLWWRQSNDVPPLTLEDVLDRALAFHLSREGRVGESVLVSRVAAPADFPRSDLIVGLRSVPRWQHLDGRFLGRAGVVYDLIGAEQQRASLYVLASDGRPEIPSLPDRPYKLHTTGGYTIDGWREKGRIQLLVVEGDADRFRNLLTPQGEIA
jgi:hypothetical protein